jgi:hypothetical protein
MKLPVKKEDKEFVAKILMESFKRRKDELNGLAQRKKERVGEIIYQKKRRNFFQRLKSSHSLKENDNLKFLIMPYEIDWKISEAAQELYKKRQDLKYLEDQYKLSKKRFVELDNLLFRLNIPH